MRWPTKEVCAIECNFEACPVFGVVIMSDK